VLCFAIDTITLWRYYMRQAKQKPEAASLSKALGSGLGDPPVRRIDPMVAETHGEVQDTARGAGHTPLWARQRPHIPYAEARALVEAVFPGLSDLHGRLAASSLYQYTRIGLVYLTFCKGDATVARDPASLRQWRQEMVRATGFSPCTINQRLAAVKTLVRASARCGALPASVHADFDLVEKVSRSAMRARMKRTRNRLEPEEVRRLCRAPDPTTFKGLRDRALLLTLATSGCRIGEVCTLTRPQIQRQGERLVIEVLGKGQERARLAPLSEEALLWIERWLAARSRFLESPWIFTRFWHGLGIPTGKRLTRQGAYKVIKRYAEGVGLPYIMPHDFRKFVGTQIADRFDLRQAQHVLGHKLLSTTEQDYVLDQLLAKVTDDLF
jgi:integrase/recombinase XerD